jgi:hypothetical protein
VLPLLVVTALGAGGHVTLTRCLQATPERCADVGERARDVLRAARLTLGDEAAFAREAQHCNGTRDCLLREVREAGGSFLVSVEVAQIGDRVAIRLDGSTAAGKRVAETGVTVSAMDYPAGVDRRLGEFAEALARVVGRASDAPARVDLAPVRVEPVPEPLAPARPSRAGPVTLTTLAVIGAAASLTLVLLAAENAVTLEGAKTMAEGEPASTLTRDQAVSRRTAGNAELTGALVAAIAAVVLGAGALWWWL